LGGVWSLTRKRFLHRVHSPCCSVHNPDKSDTTTLVLAFSQRVGSTIPVVVVVVVVVAAAAAVAVVRCFFSRNVL
jgi:hypothetical protein